MGRILKHVSQYSICGKTRGGSAMYFYYFGLNQWGVNENLRGEGFERHQRGRGIPPTPEKSRTDVSMGLRLN